MLRLFHTADWLLQELQNNQADELIVASVYGKELAFLRRVDEQGCRLPACPGLGFGMTKKIGREKLVIIQHSIISP